MTTVELDIRIVSVFVSIVVAIGGGFWFAGQMASNFENLQKNMTERFNEIKEDIEAVRKQGEDTEDRLSKIENTRFTDHDFAEKSKIIHLELDNMKRAQDFLHDEMRSVKDHLAELKTQEGGRNTD